LHPIPFSAAERKILAATKFHCKGKINIGNTKKIKKLITIFIFSCFEIQKERSIFAAHF
jgi:hypothetical protein